MQMCKNCGSDEWNKIYENSYSGHKSRDGRNETTKEVFECQNCGKEGRKFTDGVSGGTTFSGAMRA